MHDRKSQILLDLDPRNPASIQALINFHRQCFGGFVMTAGTIEPPAIPPAAGAPPAATPPADGQQPPKPDDNGDQTNWEDRFKGQQKVNRDLEEKLNGLRNGLAAALGVEPKKTSTDDIVATLQQQMADLAHNNLVLSVANTHKITDPDDLALLAEIKDEAALRKLAARIKPSDAPPATEPPKKRTPAPDPSQGRSTGAPKPGEAGKAEAARRFAKQQ